MSHPATVKPELLALAPNQVWSWDITKLLGPARWTYFHLYVIIDILSRCVPGWLLAHRESAELAERLLGESVRKHGIEAHQLTIHADRGTSMASKSVALLLVDLGVIKSHSVRTTRTTIRIQKPSSRPSSTDRSSPNASVPSRTRGSSANASSIGYNNQHRHSGLGFHTPADVHFGRVPHIQLERAHVLAAAYTAHPERFVRQRPLPPALPGPAWINRPTEVTPASNSSADRSHRY